MSFGAHPKVFLFKSADPGCEALSALSHLGLGSAQGKP